MKKNVLLISALFFSIVLLFVPGNSNSNTAKANPIVQWRFDASPIIAIQSPETNETYSPDSVILVFNLTKPTADLGGYPYSNNWFEPINSSSFGDDFGNRVVNATYYLDGQPSNVSIEVNSHLLEPFNYSLPLKGLEDGNHTLQMCLFCDGVEGYVWMAGGSLWYDNYYTYSQIVNFTVYSSDAAMATTNPLSDGTIVPIGFLVAAICLVVSLLLYRRHLKMLRHLGNSA
ncbi:MAG: hypothetical protein NWE98_02995 [Candidatus Bathyarchaeota archaeon]|nr:hypothetical protein [Candidatus Bathyarchaeota archaeon]